MRCINLRQKDAAIRCAATTREGFRSMSYRLAAERGALAARKEVYPHLLCRWSLDPASHRLLCAWAPPASGSDLPLLARGPRLVPDDAIPIGEPV